MSTPAPVPVKPGVKTSEFCVVLGTILSTLVVFVVNRLPVSVEVAFGGAANLTAIGYALSRAIVKSSALKATVHHLEAWSEPIVGTVERLDPGIASQLTDALKGFAANPPAGLSDAIPHFQQIEGLLQAILERPAPPVTLALAPPVAGTIPVGPATAQPIPAAGPVPVP